MKIWMKISKDFESKWQIPHCVGALYRQAIIAREETVNAIVQATVILHNFVKNKETEYGTYYNYIFIYVLI